MGAVIIAFALLAILVTGASYYVVIPYYFNIKASFAAHVTDARALAFGETVYDIVGIFPLLFFGAIALNAWTQSHRQSNADEVFS